MNGSKRFYWIKLKTDFFNQDTIDFLLSQENGCEYIVLYQMLCLNTANNDGKLSSNVGEMIVPYDVKKIVRDTKYFTFDTVTIALGLFKQLGLIYEEEDKVLRIKDFGEMVGSEAGSSNAQRQKRFRERHKQLKIGVTNSNASSNASNVIENNEEIEIDKEIEKDIEIDIDKEKKKERKKENNYDSIIDEMVSDENIKEALYEFLKMRKLIKKPMTDRALKQLINKLFSLATNKQEQLEILDNSIINNWSSIYPLKKESNNSYKRTEIVPDWFDKKVDNISPSKEETAEMETILGEITGEEVPF